MPGLNGDGRNGRVNDYGHNGHSISTDPAATAGEAINLRPMTDEFRPPLEVPSAPPDCVPRDWPEWREQLLHRVAGIMKPEELHNYIEAHHTFFLAALQGNASLLKNQAGVEEARDTRSPEAPEVDRVT
jgi:hypothetical protein